MAAHPKKRLRTGDDITDEQLIIIDGLSDDLLGKFGKNGGSSPALDPAMDLLLTLCRTCDIREMRFNKNHHHHHHHHCVIIMSCRVIIMSCHVIIMSCHVIIMSCRVIIMSCRVIIMSCRANNIIPH